MMKNKNKIAILCTTAAVLLLGTASFMAFFISDKAAQTDMPTGIVNVDLVEDFTGSNGGNEEGTDPDGEGLENATKVIKGHNTGTQPAYVRVKIFPVVETLQFGNWYVNGGISTSYIKYDISNSGWTYNESDGYYYYNKILNATEETSEITVKNLRLEMPDEIASIYQYDTLRVNMLVQLESTQSSNELWKINWGIDSLPSSVEQ